MFTRPGIEINGLLKVSVSTQSVWMRILVSWEEDFQKAQLGGSAIGLCITANLSATA
jgi:hypothetical protein